MIAIQIAALSGFSPIITTASLRNKDFVTSLGATHVLDRSLDAAALTASIKSIIGGTTLRYVFDGVGTPETQKFSYRLIADADGGSLLSVQADAVTDEDKAKGKKVEILNPFPNNHPEFIKELFENLPKYLESGAFKVNHHLLCDYA